jgi:hypothetical protein
MVDKKRLRPGSSNDQFARRCSNFPRTPAPSAWLVQLTAMRVVPVQQPGLHLTIIYCYANLSTNESWTPTTGYECYNHHMYQLPHFHIVYFSQFLGSRMHSFRSDDDM